MKVLISGGNFVNKGAEAMMMITVNECCRIFDSPHFVLQLPGGFAYVNSMGDMYTLSRNYENYTGVRVQGKFRKLASLVQAYVNADLMIDISGLELCSKLGVYPSLRYLFKIALSKWTGTKVFLMPQSFGPFEYGKGFIQRLMTLLISHYMKYPCVCFAREKDGVEELLKISPKANVILSSDLVLQNKNIEYFFETKDLTCRIDIGEHCVGFVPNKRMYEQYGKEPALNLFVSAIKAIRKEGFNVYILCHATDDIAVADEIKLLFKDDESVTVIRYVLSCFEYQQIVKKFEFVIASRYHSIVHAYKECVPCIAIGWAIKYRELLSLLKQDRYLLDINDSEDNVRIIVKKMAQFFSSERDVISQELKVIQKRNCFDSIKQYIQ